MIKYYIESYKNVYDVISNGIGKSAILYNKDEIIKAFEEQSENRILAVFEVDESNITLVDPYELGIFNKLSHCLYSIHIGHDNYIMEKIKKVSSNLNKKGHSDLSEFLNLTTNISLKKSGSIDIDSFVQKLGEESEAKAGLFKKIYDEMYLKAKSKHLDNPIKLAAMSALKIMGLNVRGK
jgi:hypothetical protein